MPTSFRGFLGTPFLVGLAVPVVLGLAWLALQERRDFQDVDFAGILTADEVAQKTHREGSSAISVETISAFGCAECRDLEKRVGDLLAEGVREGVLTRSILDLPLPGNQPSQVFAHASHCFATLAPDFYFARRKLMFELAEEVPAEDPASLLGLGLIRSLTRDLQGTLARDLRECFSEFGTSSAFEELDQVFQKALAGGVLSVPAVGWNGELVPARSMDELVLELERRLEGL